MSEAEYQLSLQEQAYYKAMEAAAAFVDSGAVSVEKFIEDLKARLCK